MRKENDHYSKPSFTRWICVLCGLMLIALPTGVRADVNIEQVPTSWRLQQYGPNSAAAYYTSSSCTSGQITVPTSYSAEDISRFWATVLTARALGLVVGIYYDNTTPACFITSYYLKEM